MKIIDFMRHIWRTYGVFSPLRKLKYKIHLKKKALIGHIGNFFKYGQKPSLLFFKKKVLAAYIEHIDDFIVSKKEVFVPESTHSWNHGLDVPSIIAFYLPQYYHFSQNDQWHGKGFTEWTTTIKGFPMYVGHHQPHIPYDVGFYNLQDSTVMHRQVDLAKRYGVSGFCFYYYWFSGQRLMEKPVNNFLHDTSIDFPFCLCWACDRWNRRWDSGTEDLLMDSFLAKGDAKRFFEDIYPFVSDSRYIRIDGRPLLHIYHVRQFEYELYMEFIEELQSIARENGFRFYISIALTNDFFGEIDYTCIRPETWGGDAFMEFPPHGRLRFESMPRRKDISFVNPVFKGKIYDMDDFFLQQQYEKPLVQGKCFRTVFPSWDNTARKWQTSAMVYSNITPERYGQWLENSLQYTRTHLSASEQMVFVNAWNEWGEGAHLEPDLYYGYAYLEETRRALERISLQKIN